MLKILRMFLLYARVIGPINGIWVLIRWCLFRQPFEILFRTEASGQPVVLRVGTSDVEVAQKIFLDREYDPPFSANPTTLLDLGANTGLATLHFHSRFPSAKIVAVEPDPENFAVLLRNLAHLPNVTCINAAAWSHDGTVRLVDPGIGAWGMRVAKKVGTCSDCQEVTAVSMAVLLQHFPGGRLDLLKMDVEGAEKEIFTHFKGWVDQVQSIVIELHDRYTPGCSRTFFNAIPGFSHEHWAGENVWVWR
jgi:FkbM family methyltransferase